MNRQLILGIALLVVCSSTTVNAQFGSWELGIEYPQDNEDVPFEVRQDGTASVVFFVSNEELLDIVVEFEYDIPCEGEGDGPESETIGAGETSRSLSGYQVSMCGISLLNPRRSSQSQPI